MNVTPDLDSIGLSHYPGGMMMPGRKYSSASGYRYGFNGQEESTEIGNHSYTAEYWQYDSRIGRRWNIDPKPNAGISSYATFSNNPIFYSDPLGDTTVTGAGGTHSIDIDERQNSLEYYNSNTNYTVSGTQTPVPVQPGQLRSFSNALGKFSAKLTTDANGIATFAGYKNDKNQTVDAAVQELNEFASSWKYKLWSFGNWIQNEHDKEPVGFNLKITTTMLTMSAMAAVEPVGYSPGYNPSVTTQESMSALGTLNITQRSLSTLSLVTKYPANPAIAGTIENTVLMPGQIIDRYGGLGGRWFSIPGTSYGARSIPPGFSPYTQFRVLKPFEVQKSLASPGMFSGQSGFGIQYESPVGAEILIKRKIITPF